MNVSIKITGTVDRKDAVKNVIIAQLNAAKAAGNIEEATWSVSQNMVPEGGVIK
jgi:hypothetical protein